MREQHVLPVEDLYAMRIEFDETIRPKLKHRPEAGYATWVIRKVDDLPSTMKRVITGFKDGFVSATFTVTQPNYGVHEHTDDMHVKHSRWHIPLHTTGTVLWEDGERIELYEGFITGPIRYWVPHSVDATLAERGHIIIDYAGEEVSG